MQIRIFYSSRKFYLYLYVILELSLFFLNAQNIPSVHYEKPGFVADPNSTLLLSSVYLQNNATDLALNDYYIIRKSIVGNLSIWDINNHTLKYQILWNTPTLGTMSCKQFDIEKDNNQTLVILTTMKRLVLINLAATATVELNKALTFSASYSDVQVVRTQIVMLGLSSNYLNKIERYYLNGSYRETTTGSRSYQIFKMETCQPSPTSSFYYLVLWKADCYFQIYKCYFSARCNSTFMLESPNCGSVDFAATTATKHEVRFNSDCSRVIFRQRGIGSRVIYTQSGSIYHSYPTTAYRMTQITFLDQLNLFIGAVTDLGNVRFFQNLPIPNDSFVYATTALTTSLWQFNRKKKIFVATNNDGIYTYRLICQNISLINNYQGVCLECPADCIQCQTNGTCLKCKTNYSLQTNNSCLFIDTQQSNSSMTVNETINSQGPQNYLIKPTICDNLTVAPIYDYEEAIGITIHENIGETVIDLAVVAIKLLQFFPFSFLFIRFINFWSICSIYLLLQVRMPKHLYEVLEIMYQGINQSIFKAVNLDFTFNTNLEEKVTGNLNKKYGLSSDFVNSNFQNIGILFFSYLVLFVLFLIKKSLNPSNIFHKIFSKINHCMAFIGQYVALMSSFYLNIRTIQNKCFQSNYYQKLNIVLHVLFMILSSLTPAIAFRLIQNCKLQKQQEKKQKRDWFINCLCNSLIPFTAVLGILPLFFSVNLFFFVYQVALACKQKSFRINCIILSLYLPIFHIGFTIMTVFDQRIFPGVFHHAGICIIIVLFIGAIHELSTLILGVLYDLLSALRQYRSSVSAQEIQKQASLRVKNQVKIMPNATGNSLQDEFDLKKIRFLPTNIKRGYLQNSKLIFQAQINDKRGQEPHNNQDSDKKFIFHKKAAVSPKKFIYFKKYKRQGNSVQQQISGQLQKNNQTFKKAFQYKNGFQKQFLKRSVDKNFVKNLLTLRQNKTAKRPRCQPMKVDFNIS